MSAAAEARQITVAPINRFCLEPIAAKGLFASIDRLARAFEGLDAASPGSRAKSG